MTDTAPVTDTPPVDPAIALLQRENALLRAMPGVDTSRPHVQAFLASYTGDTAPDALVAAAGEWNIAAPAPASAPAPAPAATDPATTTSTETPPATPPAPSADEAQQAAIRAQLASQSETPGVVGDVDPRTAGIEGFYRAKREGNQPSEAAAAEFFSRVWDAAAKSDRRVIYDPKTAMAGQ